MHHQCRRQRRGVDRRAGRTATRFGFALYEQRGRIMLATLFGRPRSRGHIEASNNRLLPKLLPNHGVFRCWRARMRFGNCGILRQSKGSQILINDCRRTLNQRVSGSSPEGGTSQSLVSIWERGFFCAPMVHVYCMFSAQMRRVTE